MSTQTFETAGTDGVVSVDHGELSRSDLLQQLERVVASKHFRNSKRYPSLLRFVVEQTLAGNTETLKERTLGINVFGKPNDYDTNADPIVRVTAGEIRKRIAQYYQEPEHENELRIDLPLGSYVPHFGPSTHTAHLAPADPVGQELHSPAMELPADRPAVAPRPSAFSRHRLLAFAALLVLLASAAALFTARAVRTRAETGALTDVWKPLLSSGSPALIAIGVHTLDDNGHDIPPDVNANEAHDQQQSMLSAMIRSDMVPVSDILSYSKVTDLLTRRSHPYVTRGSDETTFDQLRQGPVILIGGLDNVWTLRLTSRLRYRFFAKTAADSSIQDTEHPSTVWTFDNTQRALGNTRDYAVFASYYDPSVEQHVVIIAGIGKAGTQAAAEFATSDKYLKQSHLSTDRNVELILSTEILDGSPGPPHVIAGYTW